MTTWLTQTRHTSTCVLGGLLAILCPLIAINSGHAGLNLWPDFVTGLSQTSVYTGILAVGFCAWEGGRWAAPGTARLPGSVRSALRVRLVHAAAVTAPVIAGFLISLMILAVIGMTTGTYGAPFVPWLVALGSALVAACASGYAAGATLGKRWFVPPLAAVLFLGAFILSRVATIPYGARSLYPVILNTDDTFVRYIAPTMWGQTALFLSASLLLIILVSGGWRHGRRPLVTAAIAGLAGIGIVGAAVVLTTNGQYTTGYNSRDFVCSGSTPEICLNKGYVEAMPALQARFRSLNEKARGTALTATVLEQNGEGIGDVTTAGARSLYLETLDHSGVGFAVSRYLGKYGGAASCDYTASDLTSFTALSIVNTWLSGFDELGLDQIDETAPGGSEYARFMKLGIEEGNAWLRANEAAYMNCSLTFDDLP